MMRRFLMSFFVAATLLAGSPVHAKTTQSEADALREGIELYEREDFDAAREKLVESTLSEDAEVRTRAFLYLSSIEMEAEDFAAAKGWLELYHTEAMAIFRAALEAENRGRGSSWWIAVIVAIVGAVGVGAAMLRRKERHRSEPIDIASWQRYRADAERFRQTTIYAEIVELASQSERGRGARVMTSARQETLDRELAITFSHFAVRLQSEFPILTAGEVKFCCLSLAGLSSWARALCLGSTETNIVKQRKHKLKSKLPAELVEFIFDAPWDGCRSSDK